MQKIQPQPVRTKPAYCQEKRTAEPVHRAQSQPHPQPSNSHSASKTRSARASTQQPVQRACTPPDAASGRISSTQQRLVIDTICASVVAEIKQTLGWNIDIKPDIQVVFTDRRSLKRHLQHEYQIESAVQRFLLSRVTGVLYIPSMTRIVIVDEVTRRWHPELLAHEVAKATVRLSLALYANREANQDNGEVLKFEKKIDQIYSIEYRYRRSVRSMASFLAAHAQFIANKLQPTKHTSPITQKFWGILVWFTMHTFYKVRSAGCQLAESTFEKILAYDRGLVSRIYAHIRMAEVYYGGVGMVRINSASKATADQIERDLAFLHSLNLNKGAVAYQVDVGQRSHTIPELRASDLHSEAASAVV